MTEELTPFFVYGTLLPQQPNAFLWHDSVTHWQAAKLMGVALYDLGHFPMCVEEPAGSIHGMVAHVYAEQYSAVTQRLDQLEGFNPAAPETSSYRRLRRQVTLADGTALHTWVYIGRREYVIGRHNIVGGDWLSYCSNDLAGSQKWWDSYREDYFDRRK